MVLRHRSETVVDRQLSHCLYSLFSEANNRRVSIRIAVSAGVASVVTSTGRTTSFLRRGGRNTTMTTLIPRMRTPQPVQLSLSLNVPSWTRMLRAWPTMLRRGLFKTCATVEVSFIINDDVSIQCANPTCAGLKRGCFMRWRVCSRSRTD